MAIDRKQRARVLVQQAIWRGDLIRPKLCENCGLDGFGSIIRAHHPDYSKPLQVEWLCNACHALRHAGPRKPISPLRADEYVPEGMLTLDGAARRYGVSPMLLRSIRARKLIQTHQATNSARQFLAVEELDRVFALGRYVRNRTAS